MDGRDDACFAAVYRDDATASHAGYRKGTRRWLAPILAALLVLTGLCLLLYPVASDYLNKVEQAKVSNNLRQVVQEATPEDLSAWRQQAIDYNDRLYSGAAYVIDPFDPNAPKTSDEEYLSCLNLAGDGAMGTIVIPSIGVDLPIYHGVTGEGMDHGVGHEPNSSLPVGGPSTHAVLAGHTGLPSAVIFDKLDKLHVGDYFVLQVLDEDLAYRVTSTEVVLPDDTSSLAIQKDKDLVTLVTCTPYGVNSHRLLIHAERCDVPKEWLERKD
ncbi:MAG: class C sortase, partial [Collinsella sp.]|nr:class C sortase [Collinsella sp.]